MIKVKLNKFWKAVGAGVAAFAATILTYYSWYESNKQNKVNIQLQNQMVEIQEDIKNVGIKLDKIISDNQLNESIKESCYEKISSLNKEIENIEKLYYNTLKTIEEQIEGVSLPSQKASESNKVLENTFEIFRKEMGELISNSSSNGFAITATKANELEKFIDDIKDMKFMENNPISELIFEFNKYLSTLSVYELCILMNVFLCIFIFTCLISILFAFYGNYFISKFNLEEKYPKFSKIIRLRVQFQQYYIILNSLAITLALSLQFYVNLATLLKL